MCGSLCLHFLPIVLMPHKKMKANYHSRVKANIEVKIVVHDCSTTMGKDQRLRIFWLIMIQSFVLSCKIQTL